MCVCVCVCVCVYKHTNVYIYTYLYTCGLRCCVCLPVCVPVAPLSGRLQQESLHQPGSLPGQRGVGGNKHKVFSQRSLQKEAHKRVALDIYIYIHIYIYMCVCVCIYAYIYMNTHIAPGPLPAQTAKGGTKGRLY